MKRALFQADAPRITVRDDMFVIQPPGAKEDWIMKPATMAAFLTEGMETYHRWQAGQHGTVLEAQVFERRWQREDDTAA